MQEKVHHEVLEGHRAEICDQECVNLQHIQENSDFFHGVYEKCQEFKILPLIRVQRDYSPGLVK